MLGQGFDRPTLGSLFDGIGGFPLAAERQGFVALWASEIEATPIKITRAHFPHMEQVGSITELKGERLPPVDVVTGGSPCQNLSIAGQRAGLTGERSALFFEQIRITKELRDADRNRGRTDKSIRPRYSVWENVTGVFSSNGCEDFRTVLEEFSRIADDTVSVPRPAHGLWRSAGCIMGNEFSVAWRVLDAQYWGVPQRRKRVFVVADFAGASAPEILFKQDRLFGDTTQDEGERA